MTEIMAPGLVPVRSLLPETGYIRLKTVLQIIPVSPSTWWEGCRTGRYPKPVKLGPRITAWKVADIKALLQNPEHQ